MPGPTTEVLNEDVKEVKSDLRDVRSSIEVLKGDVHRTGISLAELRGEFGLAKWLIGLTLVATLSGIGTGIWWAATITADLHNLEVITAEKFKAAESASAEKFKVAESASAEKFRSLEARFDRLEAAITKMIEQTKPKP